MGVLNKSVNTTDVLMGAAIGFGGTLLMKGMGNKMLAGKVPDFILKGSPLVGGAIAGGLAYAYQSKKNMGRANGWLFGALMAGASVQGWDVLKTSFPEGLGDVVSLQMDQYGVLVDEPQRRLASMGLLVDEPARRAANLAELAALSADDGDSSSGIEELMNM
jgi:hypothetical protein